MSLVVDIWCTEFANLQISLIQWCWGEGQLRQFTQTIVGKSEFENVLLSKESLVQYYTVKDATKSVDDVEKVYKKCVDQVKDDNPDKLCVGGVATNLVKSLKKKYGDGPTLEKRFAPEVVDAKPDGGGGGGGGSNNNQQQQQQQQQRHKPTQSSGGGKSDQPNLHLATKEELLAEIERRLDAERDIYNTAINQMEWRGRVGSVGMILKNIFQRAVDNVEGRGARHR